MIFFCYDKNLTRRILPRPKIPNAVDGRFQYAEMLAWFCLIALLIRNTPKCVPQFCKKWWKKVTAVLLSKFRKPSSEQRKSLPQVQKPKVISVRGLSNLGNTCYMNAALQCLHKTPQLTEDLIHCQKAKKFVKAYLELMTMLSEENTEPCKPKLIKSLIQQHNSRFIGNHQQDSSQLLMAILNYISEQTQQIYMPKAIQNHVNFENNQLLCNSYRERDQMMSKTIIDDIFIGRFLTTYQCRKCGKQEKLFEKFHLMHLPIPHKKDITLQDCMRQFCKPDVLKDANAWWCNNCREDTQTHKFMSVYEANQIIMICLKRFNYMGEKINDFIHFDQEITLKDISTNPKIQENKYSLYGVINHSGYCLNYGHYYSYCHDGTTWKEYNDNIVRPEPNIVSDNAFVLFYRRKQT